MAQDIVFIDGHPKATLAQQNALGSAVRSHAARIAHQRAHKGKWKRMKFKGGVQTCEDVVSEESDTPLPASIVNIDAGGAFEPVVWISLNPQQKTKKTKVKSKSKKSKLPSNSEERPINVLIRRASANSINIQPATEIDVLSKLYWRISAPSSARFCEAMKTKSIFTEEWLHLLRDDAFFHVGGALIKFEYRQLVDPSQSQSEIIDHKIKACKIIRQRIEENNGILDNATILAILFLPALENVFNANDPRNVHWSALSKLLQARMRVRPLHKDPYGMYVIDVLNQYHSFALYHAKIDLLEDIDPDQKPLIYPKPTLMQGSEMPFDMPIGFRILKDKDRIGKSAMSLACNLMRIIEEQEGCTPDDSDFRPKHTDLPVSFMNTWGLLDLKPSSIPGQPSIEDVLPCAITMYTSRIVAGPLHSINIVGRCAQSHLVSQIMKCDVIRSDEEENALFWSWVVAIETLKTRLGGLSPEGLELRDSFNKRFQHYRPPVNARLVLEQFFCDDELWRDYQKLMLQK